MEETGIGGQEGISAMSEECENCLGFSEVVPEDLIVEARSLLDYVAEHPTPKGAQIQKLALYALQRAAQQIPHKERKWLGQQPADVAIGDKTRCPSCRELADYNSVYGISPPVYNYLCSRGHCWSHQVNFDH